MQLRAIDRPCHRVAAIIRWVPPILRAFGREADTEHVIANELKIALMDPASVVLEWVDEHGQSRGLALGSAILDAEALPAFDLRWIEASQVAAEVSRETLLAQAAGMGWRRIYVHTPHSDRAIRARFPTAEPVSTLWRLETPWAT